MERKKRSIGLVMSVIAIFLFIGISTTVSASEMPLSVGNSSVSQVWWEGMNAEEIAKELLRDDPPSGNNPPGSSYSVEMKGNMFMELATADVKLAGEVFNHMSILDIEKTRDIIKFTDAIWKNPSVFGKVIANTDPDRLADLLNIGDIEPVYRHYEYRTFAYIYSLTSPMIAVDNLIKTKKIDRKAAGNILEELAEIDIEAHAKIIGWLWALE